MNQRVGSKQKKKKSQVLPYASPAVVVRREAPASAVAGFAAWGFAALVVVGFLMFRTEGTLAYGNMMSSDRALFTVVNAATLTGFQLPLAVDHYNWPGQWMILLLTIGGTQFALIAGGIAVARIAKLPYSDDRIAVSSIIAQGAVIVIGFLTLHRSGQPIVATLLQASSAFGNSGVWMGSVPDLLAWRTHLILLPLALLGGLGLPVLMDLFDAVRGKRALSVHTTAVLKWSAILYLVGLCACFVVRVPADGKGVAAIFASSSAVAINARSAGLPIEFAADFPRQLQWILILLMGIGGAPGGTGGGLKVTTIGCLLKGTRDTVAGKPAGRVFGIALIWLAAFCLLVFVTVLMLLFTEPGLEADQLLFTATSAAANAGLSHDRIGIVGPGMRILSFAMLVGRMLPIGILWWVVRHSEETDVAIG